MKPANRLLRSILFACVLCGLLTQFDARALAPIRMGTRNCVMEWSFSSAKVYADPFNEVEMDVLITAPDGAEQRVPAFWAGEQTWRVRYAPHTTGRFLYRTACSDTNNSGLHGQQGELEVTAYTGNNPLYRHGPVRIAADQRHFAHADGTPFFWLGDTWWMGLCRRLRWPEDFQLLTADRVQKGFTVIQVVAGLYPDMPEFDPRGANEAGFPWDTEKKRINPAYFDAADLRIQYLVERGPGSLHCRLLGLPSAHVRRAGHEEALAKPGRSLGRLSGHLVPRRRGFDAGTTFQTCGPGCSASETRLG